MFRFEIVLNSAGSHVGREYDRHTGWRIRNAGLKIRYLFEVGVSVKAAEFFDITFELNQELTPLPYCQDLK